MTEPGTRNRIERSASAVAVALILLVPWITVFPVLNDGPLRVGLPRVFAGDEPHYLIALHSVSEDGDLDVANQYAAAAAGGLQAGLRYAARPLDHHTGWYSDGGFVGWWDRYTVDADGGVVPLYPTDTSPKPTHEYPTHPPGLALLLAPLAFALRGSAFIEPAVVLATAAATLSAFLLLRELFRGWTSFPAVAAAMVVVASPMLVYGRSFFSEPWLLLFAVGAYALGLRRNAWLGAGALIAAGVLMKPPFALLAVPLVVDRLRSRALGSAVAVVLPVAAAVGAILALNHAMHGSMLRSSMPWLGGNPLRGAAGLIFSGSHGIMFFCPLALVAVAAWPAFLRRHPREAGMLLAAFGLYFGLMATWRIWAGGYCYGPRLILPVLPFLLASLTVVPETDAWRRPGVRLAAVAIAIGSVAVTLIGAFGYEQSWNAHPFVQAGRALARALGPS